MKSTYMRSESPSYMSGWTGATALFALILGAGWHLRWPMVHPDPMTPEAYVVIVACIGGIIGGLYGAAKELYWMALERKMSRRQTDA